MAQDRKRVIVGGTERETEMRQRQREKKREIDR